MILVLLKKMVQSRFELMS